MYRPKEVAERLGVSAATLRRWSEVFSPHLSGGAGKIVTETGTAGQRRYTDADVAVLSHAKTLLDGGHTYDEVQRRLVSGWAGAPSSESERSTASGAPEDHPGGGGGEGLVDAATGALVAPATAWLALAAFQNALTAKDQTIDALTDALTAKDAAIAALTQTAATADAARSDQQEALDHQRRTIDALTEALTALSARPWWKRLLGLAPIQSIPSARVSGMSAHERSFDGVGEGGQGDQMAHVDTPRAFATLRDT